MGKFSTCQAERRKTMREEKKVTTLIKKIRFSSYIKKKIQKGSVAKSYMTITASSYMVKYYETLPHI
jgi:hypothetical protein